MRASLSRYSVAQWSTWSKVPLSLTVQPEHDRALHAQPPRPDDDDRLAAAFASDSEAQPGLTRAKAEPSRNPKPGSKFKLTAKIKR